MPDMIKHPNFEGQRSTDFRLPDSTVGLADGGTAIISHAELFQLGYMPRKDSIKEIALVTIDMSGDEPVGLIVPLSPDEARNVARSMLELADEAEAKKAAQ